MNMNGDVLSDLVEVDGEMVSSSQQVFWCSSTGSWRIDESYKQDKSSSSMLSESLSQFEYEVAGSIHIIK